MTNLSQVGHLGAPPRETYVYGLELAHAHTYRLLATVTNPFGLSSRCISSHVTIDVTPPLVGHVMMVQHDSDNNALMPQSHAYQYSTKVHCLSLFGSHPAHPITTRALRLHSPPPLINPHRQQHCV